MHLAGRNHSTTMLGQYCIFTCLLNIFPSPLIRSTAPLPHFWGVRISHTARSMGPSLAPVLRDVGIACALHIFSVFLFPQCPGYLTQTRSPPAKRKWGQLFLESAPTNSFAGHVPHGTQDTLFPSWGESGTCWSLVGGNIKDWNHQKCFFLISWSFTSKHLLLLIGTSKASPSNTFYCRRSFCQVLEGT